MSSIPALNYRVELEQVNLLLEADPDNPQFLKLKKDLENIIELTSSSSSNFYNDDDDTHQVASNTHDTPNNSVNSSVNIRIGQRIIVVSADRPYAGVVTGISAGSQEASVKYFEFDTAVTLPQTSLKPIPKGSFSDPNAVQIGLKCQVK